MCLKWSPFHTVQSRSLVQKAHDNLRSDLRAQASWTWRPCLGVDLHSHMAPSIFKVIESRRKLQTFKEKHVQSKAKQLYRLYLPNTSKHCARPSAWWPALSPWLKSRSRPEHKFNDSHSVAEIWHQRSSKCKWTEVLQMHKPDPGAPD